MKALSDTEVLSRVDTRVKDTVGYKGGELANARKQALRYYRRDLFGNEEEGRSQVVTGDVAQYVDTMMPSLMRIFAGSDEVGQFEPTGQEDEEAAAQATDYVNHIWTQQNPGFLTFHNWFKDGLLYKLGTIKIWWDEAAKKTSEKYQGLSEPELQAMQADRDIEVGEPTSRLAFDPQTGMPVPVFDVEVVRTNREGRVRIEPLPPEEFLFGHRARSDEDADIMAHRSMKTLSELKAAGYDVSKLENASGDGDLESDGEVVERFDDIDDMPTARATTGEGATREVEVTEAYLHLDRDGDGIAEYLKVCYVGSVVLDIEEVDDHPFACLSPILMPHRLVGMSVADQTMDLQLISSTIVRGQLDNMYLNNAPQMGAIEGQVNIDDLLTRRPGGVIRMRSPGALFPIPIQPLGAEPMNMLEWVASQGEQRTGATRYNQGLDANTLNKTAAGINLIQNAAAQRIELIARIYAETGVKRAFRRVLALVCKHQQKAKMIRLRNKWVEMDPRGWNSRMDLTINVGLGNGNRDQQLMHLMSLLQLDEKIVQMQGGANGPLVTMSNIFAKLKKISAAAGFKDVDALYTDPSSPQGQQAAQQPPPPDPKMIEAQARVQESQAKLQIEQQSAQDKAQIEMKRMEIEELTATGRMQMEERQTNARIQMEREKMAHEMALAERKLMADIELAQLRPQLSAQVAASRPAPGAGA